MKKELVSMIISAAHRFEAESNAAHDLWSWLPSCAVAKKHHGDYYSEFTPDQAEVMREAACVLAQKAGYEPREDRDLMETCPCGDSHEDATDAEAP